MKRKNRQIDYDVGCHNYNINIYKTSARNVLQREPMGSFSALSGMKVTKLYSKRLCIRYRQKMFSSKYQKQKP